MAATISIQDLATDRDIALTVSGMDAFHSLDVYYLKVDEDSPNDWTLLDTLTANGTTNYVLPANGYYWFYGKDLSIFTGEFELNFARGLCSSGAAIYDQIVDCVVARLQDSINSSGFPRITDPLRVVSSYVYDPIVFTANVPGIAVIGNGRKIPMGGNNEEDDKGYPVMVICADRATSNTPRRAGDDYYLWQERIEQLFEHKRMPSVTKDGITIVWDVDISYPETVQFIQQNYHDVRVALQLNVKTREARTP